MTRYLAKLIKLQIGAKEMLAVNLDIQDCLTNGQTGNISHTEFAYGSVWKVYIKFFDERACWKAMRSFYLSRTFFLFSIKKVIPNSNKETASPYIKLSQFPIILTWTSTVNKVQFLRLEQGVIDPELRK